MKKIRSRTKVLIFVIVYMLIVTYGLYPIRVNETVPLSSDDIKVKVLHDNWDSGLVHRVEEGEDILKESIKGEYPNINTKYIELKGADPYIAVADPAAVGYFTAYGKVTGTSNYEGKTIPVFEAKYTDFSISRIFIDNKTYYEEHKLSILSRLIITLVLLSPLVLIIIISLIISYLKDLTKNIRKEGTNEKNKK